MSRRYLALLFLVLPVVGCGERPLEFVEIEGTVTHGGRPMANIEVLFFGEEGTVGPRTSGITDSAGHYKLQTEAGQSGAVTGHHRICFTDRDPAFQAGRVRIPILGATAGKAPPELAGKLPPPSVGRQLVSRVPDAYSRPAETPLRVEVRTGTQTLDFQIP